MTKTALFKNIILFLIINIIFLQFNAADAKPVELHSQTITYATDLQADLFKIPAKKLVPAVILIHGGYWSAGNRTELSDFASKLAQNGFLAMTIDYHLLPKYSQAKQTGDITDAMWWLRENSEKLGVDSSRIGVVGISSGAYLAAWAITHDKCNSNGTHSRPNAMVSLYGPWDLTNSGINEVPESVPLVEQFCAGQDRNVLSPLYSISYPMPPVLLIHGDADKIVPMSQSINAYKQIKSVHGKCKLIIVHNDGHCFPNTYSYFSAMTHSVKFLSHILK